MKMNGNHIIFHELTLVGYLYKYEYHMIGRRRGTTIQFRIFLSTYYLCGLK